MTRSILGLIFLTTACANLQHVPNPPRSMASLEPGKDLNERKEQFKQHAFSAAQKTTTVTSTSGSSVNVRQYQDRSLLAQDGNYYRMEDYLPELQKAGVADGVDSPANHFEAINKEQRFVRYGIGLTLAAPLISFLIPGSDCGERPGWRDPEYDVFEACQASNRSRPIYYMLAGAFSGGALSLYGLSRVGKASIPIRKAKAKAAKERSSWARAYNKKLMEKLGLQEAPSVTTSP
jgi:hypothetical protein